MKLQKKVLISAFLMMLIFTYSIVVAADYASILLKRTVDGNQVISEQLFEQGDDFVQIGDYLLNRPKNIYYYNQTKKEWEVFLDKEVPMFSLMKAVIGEQQEDHSYSVRALGIVEFKNSIDITAQEDLSVSGAPSKRDSGREIILESGVYKN